MICFMDMTFCMARCSNDECSRNWEKLDKTAYNKWSESFDGDGPVAFADFSDSCPAYKKED